MLSGDAVQDIYQNFPLAICGHIDPPYISVGPYKTANNSVKLSPILRISAMMSSAHVRVGLRQNCAEITAMGRGDLARPVAKAVSRSEGEIDA
jgi:hypothetical protein